MSAGPVLAVAGNTIREAIRDRILYTLLGFAVLMIGAGVFLANLSYVEQERILQSLGFSAMRLFSVVIAIFVGINLIHREVERRTVYAILAKPVSRSQFLVGKYLGLLATIWLQLLIMALAFAGVSALDGAPLSAGHAAAIGLLAIELAVIVAVATLFSSFTTPMLAAMFTSGVVVAGSLTRDLVQLSAQTDSPALIAVTRFLHQVLPDLEGFNLTLRAVHGLPIAGFEVGIAAGYGVAYTTLLLLLATAIFARRDFR